MVRQIIASQLFAARGKPSRLQFGRLLVRGGGEPVADALTRMGWDGAKPVASTVITLDLASGAIRGSRWVTKGQLGEVKVAAKEIFATAPHDVTLILKFDDMGTLTWLATEGNRNQTTWIDSSSMDVKVIQGEKVVTEQVDLDDLGVSNFAVRFTVLPLTVDKVSLYLGAVPFSKAHLSTLCDQANISLSSSNLPTIGIKLHNLQGKLWNACPVDLLPVEQPGDQLGLGHLPLVEVIGGGQVVFPDPDLFEQESISLMRNLNYTNNAAMGRILGLYDTATTFTTAPRAPNTVYEWPEYRGALPEAAGLQAQTVRGGQGLVTLAKSKQEKYSKMVKGGYTKESFGSLNLPDSIVTVIVEAANLSLAKNTWSSYNTAENHIARCEKDTGVKIEFPMTHRMLLAYFGWLMQVRNVSSATMEQYASGLRVAHLKRGFFPPNLRPEIVKAIIKGRNNDELLVKKAPRLAMTNNVMRLLKLTLKKSAFALERKRLIWSVSCMAYRGSFRIHELLSRKVSEYDPSNTLLGFDVSLQTTEVEEVKETYLMVHLKCPKEDKIRQGVNVELFKTGSLTCPVSAYLKYRALSKVALSKDAPLFRHGNGSCYTGNQFNKDIKSLLGQYVNYDERRYLSHSFRAGYASSMAAAGTLM